MLTGLLPSAFRLPPSAFRLLPSAFRLLLSAYCLLLSVPLPYSIPPSELFFTKWNRSAINS